MHNAQSLNPAVSLTYACHRQNLANVCNLEVFALIEIDCSWTGSVFRDLNNLCIQRSGPDFPPPGRWKKICNRTETTAKPVHNEIDEDPVLCGRTSVFLEQRKCPIRPCLDLGKDFYQFSGQ